jgi:hypothetical protein
VRIRLCRSAHRFGMKRRYPTVVNRLDSTAVISARRTYRWLMATVLINTMKAC